MFFKKSIPLIFSAVLRFSIFFAISKLLLEQHAATIFISASLIQILNLVSSGLISSAKAEAIKNEISSKEFNYLFKKSIVRIVIFFLILNLVIIGISMKVNIHLNGYLQGGLLGLFILITNSHQIAAEVHGTALKYYYMITVQLFFILLSIIFLNDFILVLLFVLTLELLWLFSLRTKKCFIKNSSVTGFKRIEILSNVASAVEVPIVNMLAGDAATITYTLMIRLYSSIVTFFGQLSRPIWKDGEAVNLKFGNLNYTININLVMMILFNISLLIAFSADLLLKINDQSYLWSFAFMIFVTIQVFNRFFKNKFLSKGVYGLVALQSQTLYLAYIFGLLIIIFFHGTVLIY